MFGWSAPQTTYGLLVKGKDVVGNEAIGELQQISTSADTRPPLISDLRVEGEIIGSGEEATAQLVVSYDTDSQPLRLSLAKVVGATYSQKLRKTALNQSSFNCNFRTTASQGFTTFEQFLEMNLVTKHNRSTKLWSPQMPQPTPRFSNL